jgi:hypothetical protein
MKSDYSQQSHQKREKEQAGGGVGYVDVVTLVHGVQLLHVGQGEKCVGRCVGWWHMCTLGWAWMRTFLFCGCRPIVITQRGCQRSSIFLLSFR